jgi:hypothetical protein
MSDTRTAFNNLLLNTTTFLAANIEAVGLSILTGFVGLLIVAGSNLTIFSHGSFTQTELFQYSGTLPTNTSFFGYSQIF